MTYFHYKRARLNRGDDVYAAGTLVGRVAVRPDWKARLSLRQGSVEHYRATTVDGSVLPDLYRSRHDAAEALFEASALPAPAPDVIRPVAYRPQDA